MCPEELVCQRGVGLEQGAAAVATVAATAATTRLWGVVRSTRCC